MNINENVSGVLPSCFVRSNSGSWWMVTGLQSWRSAHIAQEAQALTEKNKKRMCKGTECTATFTEQQVTEIYSIRCKYQRSDSMDDQKLHSSNRKQYIENSIKNVHQVQN